MRLCSSQIAIVIGCAAIVSHEAEASPIIFTDRAVFEAVTGPHAFEEFDSNDWDVNISVDVCTRYLNGLTISSDCHANGVLVGGVAIFDQNVFTTLARLDEPQTSLGFDYTISSGPNPFPPFNATNVVQFFIGNLSIFLTGSGFLGVLDTSQPILRMGTNHAPTNVADGVLRMDNLLLTRVPEPATSLLVLAGATVLSQLRRFMRRK
jgi:hypothetical protein